MSGPSCVLWHHPRMARGDPDPIAELMEFWVHGEPARVLRQAGVPARVNRDLLRAVLALAVEIRDLRQALLAQPDSRQEGGATRALAGGGR